jgi:hypothetical protein
VTPPRTFISAACFLAAFLGFPHRVFTGVSGGQHHVRDCPAPCQFLDLQPLNAFEGVTFNYPVAIDSPPARTIGCSSLRKPDESWSSPIDTQPRPFHGSGEPH